LLFQAHGADKKYSRLSKDFGGDDCDDGGVGLSAFGLNLGCTDNNPFALGNIE
jgi:hypothetical protein